MKAFFSGSFWMASGRRVCLEAFFSGSLSMASAMASGSRAGTTVSLEDSLTLVFLALEPSSVIWGTVQVIRLYNALETASEHQHAEHHQELTAVLVRCTRARTRAHAPVLLASVSATLRRTRGSAGLSHGRGQACRALVVGTRPLG